MSVFCVSAPFLADVICMKTDNYLPFVYIAVMTVLHGAMLVGTSKAEFLAKLILSVPFSLAVFTWFRETDYPLRATNWVFPHYGKLGAGAGFAMMVEMGFLAVCCGIAIAAAFFIKPKRIKEFTSIQLIVGLALAVIVVIISVKLESKFPSYDSIMKYYRG